MALKNRKWTVFSIESSIKGLFKEYNLAEMASNPSKRY